MRNVAYHLVPGLRDGSELYLAAAALCLIVKLVAYQSGFTI